MPNADPLARWQAFHLVKAGNEPADYEDGFAADAARAASSSRGGSTLDMRKSSRAKLSGRPSSAAGNSTG